MLDEIINYVQSLQQQVEVLDNATIRCGFVSLYPELGNANHHSNLGIRIKACIGKYKMRKNVEKCKGICVDWHSTF